MVKRERQRGCKLMSLRSPKKRKKKSDKDSNFGTETESTDCSEN